LSDWLARQLCRYAHIQDGSGNSRVARVLTGKVVGRGPDNEPLVEIEAPVALLNRRIIEEAKAVYEERFDVGAQSFDCGSSKLSQGAATFHKARKVGTFKA
jgi:hypothetical protein